MTLKLTDPEVSFSIRLVSESMRLTRRIQQESIQNSRVKKDDSPVTLADYSVQAIAGYRLKNAFPSDPLAGEESAAYLKSSEGKEIMARVGAAVRSVIPEADDRNICEWIDCGQGKPAGRFWTLDPVDGTKGFLRGGQYVTAIALIENGKVVLGVLGCPHLTPAGKVSQEGPGAVFIALRGRGAWVLSADRLDHPEKIGVSEHAAKNSLQIIESVESSHTDSEWMNQISSRLGITKEPFRMDSQAKHAVVASGAADLLFYFPPRKPANRPIKIWDQASGAILVEEAGGRVTDFSGKPLDFSQGLSLSANRGVVVSNGLIHDEILKVIQI